MKIKTFHFQLLEDDDAEVSVRFAVLGSPDPPLQLKFIFDRSPTGRIADVLARIEANRCEQDDLRDVGSLLWGGLMSGEIGTRFEQSRTCAAKGELLVLHLELPTSRGRDDTDADAPRPLALDDLPWESLYDERGAGFLSGNPRYCIVRGPPKANIQVDVPPTQAKLNILVVIPAGSGLDTGQEWDSIQFAVARLQRYVKTVLLDGDVTPERLREKLEERPWDVVHFVGHGEVDRRGRIYVRLNARSPEREQMIPAEQFAAFFVSGGSPPRLVLMNSCSGAKSDSAGMFTGLAPALRRAGVGAVVAMRYEIHDSVAISFSKTFYRALLAGKAVSRGWVENAVTAARREIYLSQKSDNARGFVTPVLFRAAGQSALFDVAIAPDAEDDDAEPGDEEPQEDKAGAARIAVPPALLEALREKLCVPVIGPGLLHSPEMRRKGAPSLEGLVRILAEKCKPYPHPEDLSDTTLSRPWLIGMVLHTVCQHFQWNENRFSLVKEIRRHYEKEDPPPAFGFLAAWNVPGYVCTHFDGLLQEALRRRGKSVVSVNTLDAAPAIPEGVPLLVNLCGSFADAESLKLTLDDEDRLLDQLGHLPPHVSSLARGFGTSLLFIGLSPRDRFVQRLARALLPANPASTQGTAYFVCDSTDEFDKSYWEPLRVEPISARADDLLAELTALSSRGRP